MKLVKISDLFDVDYGNGLELNKLKQTNEGINFVSRTSKNNGVSAKVEEISDIKPSPAGLITVSLSGSVLEAFLQPEPFYSSYHIYCLRSKTNLTEAEKLFYCTCISVNKYRYNYGRQANRTLRDLFIPDISEIPEWVDKVDYPWHKDIDKPLSNKFPPILNTHKWVSFKIEELFVLKKGLRLVKASLRPGTTPFISSINNNNGYREFIDYPPLHEGNTITINYNGSVAEAFYQPIPFCASDDVNVLYPKFRMNQYIAMFIVSILKMEKYRFNYGRKWHLERMNLSEIKLPVDEFGNPDFEFMENYIKTLPYSKSL